MGDAEALGSRLGVVMVEEVGAEPTLDLSRELETSSVLEARFTAVY